MSNKLLTKFLIAVLFISLLPLNAVELGDKAPEVKISTWVKGNNKAIKFGDGKTVYVLDAWRTWCPASKTSSIVLTKLQEKYKNKNVVVVGISNEPPDKVKAFVKTMGNKMNYEIGIDPNSTLLNKYLKPFDIHSMPHTFIVDQEGLIVWHGHPLAGLDKVVESILSGEYCFKSAKELATYRKHYKTYFEQLVIKKDRQKARRTAIIAYTDLKDCSKYLNEFAWFILTNKAMKSKDIDIALIMSSRAASLTKSKDPNILDTYARALFELGRVKQAISVQKKAISLVKDEKLKKQVFIPSLQKYENKLKELNSKKPQK